MSAAGRSTAKAVGIGTSQVEPVRIREQLERFYQLLDAAPGTRDEARPAMWVIGGRYPEIEEFLAQPGSSTSARLNTKRKILAVLWTLWRKDRSYAPGRFLGSGSRS